ncbi:Os09g0106400 [Oryza sativa Japonica Group]|uniref:Os09g0106400 protein n=2 Tax=Oryza TaxID=4527 RepID=A0A0P0XIF5_ORYSJ|nr:Os09g0106400 [Oryza sativa Japonica Group]
MLHHHPASADMRDHCTGTPRQPDFVRRRPHRTHRQLLLAPRPLPSPPIAPRRAVPASSTAGYASPRQASLVNHRPCLIAPSQRPAAGRTFSRQAGLRRCRPRLYAPSWPPSTPPPSPAPAKCGRLPRLPG